MASRHMASRYNDSKKGNKKKTIKFSSLLILVFIIVLVFSGYKIIKWFLNNKENENIQSDLAQYVEIQKDENDTEDNTYKIDFKALKEINSDTVGWIKVNGTNIEYVVVQGDDNNYYLNHNFEKQSNNAGWIFADYKNKFDYTDYNIVIYGHNMRNDSMFGTLKNVLTSGWLKNTDNYVIKLSTEKENTLWQVFSVYRIPTTNDYLQINFSDNKDFKKFAEMLKNRSDYNFNTNINENDRIITLSTCFNKTDKLVMHAKLIKREVRS